jgi:hypothetical protein
MSIEEINKSLCYYDKRNPLFIEEGMGRSAECACDNCFRGKDKLAIELLRVKEVVSVFLVMVKEGEILVYPDNDKWIDYIGYLEGVIK